MSKYDAERVTLGIKPMGTSTPVVAPTGSKYDEDRQNYKRADEYADYSTQMKDAYNLNPDSFNVKPLVKKSVKAVSSPKKSNVLDKIFKDNPVMRVVNYPFAKAAEYSVPNASYIGEDGLIPGTNARKTFAEENPVRSTGNKTVDKVGDFAGHVGSMFTPVGTGGAFINDISKGASALLASKGGKVIEKVAGKTAAKIANTVNPVLNQAGVNISTNLAAKSGQAAVRGAALGAGYGALEPLRTGSGDLSEVPMSVAENTALFAGGDALLPFAGAGLKALGTKLSGTKLGEAVGKFFKRGEPAPVENNDILALPPASQESINAYNKRNGNVLPTNTNPIYGKGDVYTPPVIEPLGLPEPRLSSPTKGRIISPKQNSASLYDQLTNEVNTRIKRGQAQAVDTKGYKDLETAITDGYEKGDITFDEYIQMHQTAFEELNRQRNLFQESVKNIYAEIAPRDAPPLEQLMGQAYQPQKILPKNLIGKAKEQQGLRQAAGVDLPVKSIEDRYAEANNGNRLGVTSEAALPVQKMKFMGIKNPAPSPIVQEPPVSKYAKEREEIVSKNEIDNPTPGKEYTADEQNYLSASQNLEEFYKTLDSKRESGKRLSLFDHIKKGKLENAESNAERKLVKSGYDTYKISDLHDNNFNGDSPPPILKPKQAEPNFEDLDFPFENVPKEVPPGANVADDIVETAEPRVRDRVTSYLDEQIADAQARLKAKRNTLSSNPIDQYADYAIIGAGYIGKGIVKLADFSEHLIREFGEELRPHIKDIFKKSKTMYKDTELQVQKDLQGIGDIPLTLLKDLRVDQPYTKDLYRIFEQVFQGKFPQMKKAILDPFDVAKKQNIEAQEGWLEKLKSEVVDKLGIQKGSRLSGLVQRYGEKDINILELEKLAPNDYQKVVDADKWFRNAYNEIIDQVNATRVKIYPNNAEKIVPKRDDYYRHFRELDGFTGLKNLFDSPAQIDPNLVGISEFVTPKSKWASFMQKRGIGPFKNDAVGGFLNYLPSATYSTHIDPFIKVFDNLRKNVAEETTKTKNLNNFVNFLHEFSQDLAGKTNSLDRSVQKITGRKAMSVLNWVNGRVKANMVLGNAGSALSQIANIPNGVAFAKQHSVKGAGDTLLSLFGKLPEIEKSTFLKERFVGKRYRDFDTRWLTLGNPLKAKSFAIWTMEQADRIGTEFIWNSAHAKGVAEGVADPVKYADGWTRKLVAGRGVGEVPLLQKSKVFQLIAPFQLEVANLWRVQKDFVKAKDFGAIATLFLGSYLFNKGIEKVRGSKVVFDPIQAMVDAIQANKDGFKPIQTIGRLLGEVLSNVPLGQYAAALYPEQGTDILPAREEVFGKGDPTRFGESILLKKGLQDPYKILPSFGGSQIKKTKDGIKAIANNGTYVDGKLKFPVNMTPAKAAQSLIFGPNSTSEARTYYENEDKPLSVRQTEAYKASGEDPVYYDKLQEERKYNTLMTSMNAIKKDRELTEAEKDKKIKAVVKKLNKLQVAK